MPIKHLNDNCISGREWTKTVITQHITDNTTDNNTGTEPSATAGGIVVTDLPNFDGSLSPTTNVTVRANRAVGNSSPDGPLDLRLESESLLQVRGNHCDVSAPEPSWCG